MGKKLCPISRYITIHVHLVPVASGRTTLRMNSTGYTSDLQKEHPLLTITVTQTLVIKTHLLHQLIVTFHSHRLITQDPVHIERNTTIGDSGYHGTLQSHLLHLLPLKVGHGISTLLIIHDHVNRSPFDHLLVGILASLHRSPPLPTLEFHSMKEAEMTVSNPEIAMVEDPHIVLPLTLIEGVIGHARLPDPLSSIVLVSSPLTGRSHPLPLIITLKA